MSTDWRDPFADDEAAREREARWAEREAGRRERERQARESLGERVREELASTGRERPGTSRSGTQRDARAAPGSAAPPPRPLASSPAPRRRRTLGLIGLGAVIVLLTGAGVVISRSGDDGGGTPAAAQARKTIEVTIPEGYDRSQIAAVAKEAGLKGDYEKATRSSREIDLEDYGAEDATSLEGFLFPATYDLYKGAGVSALVKRQLDAFEESLSGIDMSYAESKELSVYDVVTIASMIEREIAVPDERALAASVIYNRLDANNPLGIDATIRFEDQNYDEPLLQSRLDTDTPYNTHTNAGLPPGPIGNPGLASLEAAADPAETDFFYYVVKPGTCNEHTFVETQEEFDAAQAEYNAAREAAGGKSPTTC